MTWDSSEEPGALTAHAGICGGESQQWLIHPGNNPTSCKRAGKPCGGYLSRSAITSNSDSHAKRSIRAEHSDSGLLVCIGDLMLDVLIRTARPADAMPEGISVRSGGSAANVAQWAQRCGRPSAWMGFTGDDATAEILLMELRRAGVVTYETRRNGVESGVVLSWLNGRGHRTMHSARWAASAGVEDLPLHQLRETTAVHVTGYGSEGVEGLARLSALFKAAKQYNAFLSFDPSHVGVIRTIGADELLRLMKDAGVDVIFANRKEALALTDCASARTAAKLLSWSVPMAILKDGGRGSYAAVANRIEHFPAVRTQPVDTTGAVDAYAGGWLASFLRQQDALQACEEATKIASLSIRSIGARPGAMLERVV